MPESILRNVVVRLAKRTRYVDSGGCSIAYQVAGGAQRILCSRRVFCRTSICSGRIPPSPNRCTALPRKPRGAVRDTPWFSTIMFTDIADSTGRLVAEWRRLMANHDDVVRETIDSYEGERQVHGDGHHATFDSLEQAVRCARHVIDAGLRHGLRIRSAVHTGECQTLGREVVGLAVNIASRLGDIALPGEVLVSEPVTRLVAGSGLGFMPRGSQRLKGIRGRCSTYALVSGVGRCAGAGGVARTGGGRDETEASGPAVRGDLSTRPRG
jgi:class 3 adenylate cyclase